MINCPKCPMYNKHGRKIFQQLTIIEYNYSGCGVDIASCPNCGCTFQISYKVDKIEEIK